MAYKKLRKKAFSPGQIFVYSLSLIIVSLILIYGYSIIATFIGDSSQVEMLQFKKLTEGYVSSYSTEYGSVGIKSLSAPSDVKEICFTDYNFQSDLLLDCSTGRFPNDAHPTVEDSFGTVSTREKKNLFLYNAKEEFVESYYVGNVTLRSSTDPPAACSYHCIESVRGTFVIRLQGRGDHVVISEPK